MFAAARFRHLLGIDQRIAAVCVRFAPDELFWGMT